MGNECSRVRKKWLGKLIITTVVLGVLGGLIGWHYRVHLSWKYYEWRNGYPTIQTIPHSEMPEVDIPKDWVECSLGCLRFSLPPDVATLEDTTRRTEFRVVFNDDFHTILVVSDPVTSEVTPLSELASEFIVSHDGTLTTPHIYREFCNFSTADFRWSMSSQDVVRFTLFFTVYYLSGVEWKTAETFFHDDVDRIILFYSDRRVEIIWQTTTVPLHGGIICVIMDSNSDNVERDLLVRRICQSIRIVCTCSQDVLDLERGDVDDQAKPE